MSATTRGLRCRRSAARPTQVRAERDPEGQAEELQRCRRPRYPHDAAAAAQPRRRATSDGD